MDCEPSSSNTITDIDCISNPETEPNEREAPMSAGAMKLKSWLNKPLRVEMSDKRILVGMFLCTDRDANIILGSCSEYLPDGENASNEEPRMLGLIMVPGKHIVNISIDLWERFVKSDEDIQ
ncbi:PREDICTED: N-alpha-acetyltransferase 38, NatC auxiliary subunit [Nicrophorus vespilloides]|uniref:N-alpha-acetyltransferase 38, NatC auxiliary subunit n=1 Tax=Nicrophorus vespilloides TaxID=110193 RepID=A0ABM1MZ69_NICVS|nr:PREDICTED: N-alpha-acetyltransferase 38, NatC auxiliary subunit [Nicrophorus vespilloides]XP_017779870.1 PREDICTED: N-alpha-acetyltransferase 38, NatC auxiliary subunit [Nicrophorus vespilloides]XP_017779871.1 PREDICTED: N-alpha-acetyltransferase 38, NatC auxiliary subunit [Nicrophorus vespilloides]